MPEAAPVNVMAEVTVLPVPTTAEINVPEVAVANVTTSEPMIPDNVPPEMIAAVAPSYTLLAATAPVTVSVLAVMLPVNVGWVSE